MTFLDDFSDDDLARDEIPEPSPSERSSDGAAELAGDFSVDMGDDASGADDAAEGAPPPTAGPETDALHVETTPAADESGDVDASEEPVAVADTFAPADPDVLDLTTADGEAAEQEPAPDAESEAGDGEVDISEVVMLTGDEELLAVEEVGAPAPAGDGPRSPFDRPGDWYVVHTYSGYENKVRNNLASRVRSMNVEERIHEVVIPMEDVIEFKGGRKTVVQKKVFPGYLLVRMDLDDSSWYVVRNTPGVTGFVGSGAKPTPLSRREVEDILGVEQPEGEAPVEKKARPRLDFETGDRVRVTQGPFADFDGAIAEIDEDRAKLKVLVNIFGRETPVELEFGQVARL
jgi:transcriptional antiterminator NusG